MRTTQCLPFLAAAMFALSACSSDSQSLTNPGGASAHRLSGTVISMAQPYPVIANARVEITSGADSGRFSYTDGSGVFTMSSLSGGALAVTVSKPGFETKVEAVNLNGDAAMFPKLTPTQ